MDGILLAGDPTPTGVATVVAYAVASLACLRASRRGLAGRGSFPWGWLGIALLALGLNKQLDLQSVITDVTRDAARDQGWYVWRRPIQALFVGCVAAGCLFILKVVFGRLRNAGPGVVTAIVGTAVLLSFVVIRAATFHHVDRLIGVRLGGIRLNAIFELSGIVLIAAGAMRASSVRIARRAVQPARDPS